MRVNRQDKIAVVMLGLLALCAGLAFVSLVRPGLPYDEPSHFNVVRQYAEFNGLPTPGQGGSSYEAYQPPLYYVLAGLWYRAVDGILTPAHTFYSTRIATLVLFFIPLVGIVYGLAVAATGNRATGWAAGAFVAVNPSLLAIAASVQNDSLMFLLSALAIAACVAWVARPRPPDLWRAGLLGLLVGADILTKTSALPVVAVVAIIFVVRWGRRGIGPALAVVVAAVIVCGWWFIRNVHLYGDWTGSAAVADLFGKGARYRITSAGDWGRAVRSVVTYYALPVEYWRNEVKATAGQRAAVLVGAAWIIVGAAVTMWKVRRGADDGWRPLVGPAVLVVFALAGMAFWLLICVRNYVVAPRVGMSGLAGIAVGVGAAICGLAAVAPGRRKRIPRVAVGLFIMLLLMLDISMLMAVRRVPPGSYNIRLTSDSQ